MRPKLRSCSRSWRGVLSNRSSTSAGGPPTPATRCSSSRWTRPHLDGGSGRSSTAGSRIGPAALGNFKEDPTTLARMTDFGERMWTWEELGDRCAKVGLPVDAQGCAVREDARAAVDAGAAGVFVSNHGGRQLEQAPAPLEVLPEVVSAIGGEAVVALDGGVRRGSDVLVALALGAQLVGIGRPTVWGLAAAGVEGVRRVLDLLRRELVVSMSLCGRASRRRGRCDARAASRD